MLVTIITRVCANDSYLKLSWNFKQELRVSFSLSQWRLISQLILSSFQGTKWVPRPENLLVTASLACTGSFLNHTFPHLFCPRLISLGKREILPEKQLESSQLIGLANKQKASFSTEGSRDSCFWQTGPGEIWGEMLKRHQFPGPCILGLANCKLHGRKYILHKDLSLLVKYLLNLIP